MNKFESEQNLRDSMTQKAADIEPLIAEGYTLNSLHTLSSICDLLLPRRLNPDHEYGWACISTTGLFELFDYGRGLLFVSVTVERTPDPERACCRVHIGNIDDGEWQARSDTVLTGKAQTLVDEVAKALFLERGEMTGLRVLPSSERLNEILEPFGLYGEFY
jgi:hypothetical protein